MKQYIKLQYDPSLGATMGAQAAGNVLGAGMGLLLGGIERKKQREQQQQLQNMQLRGQMQMTDYNTQKQMEMWEATGYGAQMKQLKEAGLNPGLLYGQGGGGGQTANIEAGNVTGGQARQGGEAAAMGIQMGQAQLMMAQIEMMKAQANKANADAEATRTGIPNIPLTGENIKASTANLLQGVEESKTKQALTAAMEAMENIKVAVAGATQNAEIAKIMYGLEILSNDRTISNETKDSKITIFKQQAIGAGLDNLQKIAQRALTQAETGNVKQDTQLKWQEIQHTLAKMRSLNANVDNIDNLNQIMQEANRLKEQANDLNDPTLTPQVNQIVSGVIGGLLGGRFTTTPGMTPAGFKIPQK